MIFNGLNSLRRNAIMTSIILMGFGIVLLMLPEAYLPSLIMTAGSVLIIISIEQVLEFLNSNKALIHFIILTGAIALGIIGLSVIIFQDNVLFTLGFLFGLVLVLESLHGIFHSWIYARRSERQGWWVLIPLYVLQIIFGLLIMINPWWHEAGAFKQIIGFVIVFSSIVSALRLIWVWPIRGI